MVCAEPPGLHLTLHEDGLTVQVQNRCETHRHTLVQYLGRPHTSVPEEPTVRYRQIIHPIGVSPIQEDRPQKVVQAEHDGATGGLQRAFVQLPDDGLIPQPAQVGLHLKGAGEFTPPVEVAVRHHSPAVL